MAVINTNIMIFEKKASRKGSRKTTKKVFKNK